MRLPWRKTKDKLSGRSRPEAPNSESAKSEEIIRLVHPPFAATYKDFLNRYLPEAVTHAAENPERLASHIRCGWEEGLLSEVHTAAEEFARVQDYSEMAAGVLSDLEEALGNRPEAERVLRESISRHGDAPYLLSKLADLVERRGDNDAAMGLYRKAIDLDPNEVGALHALLGMVEDRSGKLASRSLLEEIASRVGATQALIFLSKAVWEDGDHDRARALREKALNNGPLNSWLLVELLGEINRRGGSQEERERLFAVYDPVEHGPQFGELIYRLMVEEGRREEANRILADVISGFDPSRHSRMEGRDLLRTVETLGAAVGVEGLLSELRTAIGPDWAPRPERPDAGPSRNG